jgi:hypothetical protein
LKPADQDEGMKNFDNGVSHFVAVVELKIEFTQKFPFAICRLALLDEHRAVAAARELRARFSEAAQSAGSTEGFEPVTRFYMDPSFPKSLAPQIDAWVEYFPRVRLDSYFILSIHVAARRFLVAPEDIIEEGHGKQKKKTAMRSVDAVKHSLSNRGPEITHRLDREPDFKDTMVSQGSTN